MIPRYLGRILSLGALALVAATGCADADPAKGGTVDATVETETSVSADATLDAAPDVEPDAGSTIDAVDTSQDATVQVDAVPDAIADVEEPLDPVIEACTELFPPLCGKLAECSLGADLGALLAPACDALIAGGEGVIVGLCGTLTDQLPGGGFIDGLITGLLFPTIETCIEDFACTPENVEYFVSSFGDLAGLLSGGGGGVNAGSLGTLIDLFTNCDEPPPPPADVIEGDADATTADVSDAADGGFLDGGEVADAADVGPDDVSPADASANDSSAGADDGGAGTDDGGAGTDDGGAGTDDGGASADDSGAGADDSGADADDSGAADDDAAGDDAVTPDVG